MDVIAFALGHELGHEVYRALYQISPGTRATPKEEMFCDRFGLQVAYMAGFNASGAADFFDYVLRNRDRTQIHEHLESLVILTDEHLSTEARWAQVKEDFPGVDRLMTGRGAIDNGSEKTPLPDDVREALLDIRYVSPLEHLLEQRDYSAASSEEKLRLLIDLLPEITNNTRIEEFHRYVDGVLMEESLSFWSSLGGYKRSPFGGKVGWRA